jgi:CRP-like cAMP-binding protein
MHALLSPYLGTSREVVKRYMNEFRCQGYVRYSRNCIIVYHDARKKWRQDS